MNRDEFMNYVSDNFYDAGAYRLIDNILCHAKRLPKTEQHTFLMEMLEGTIGLTDEEIRNIDL